MRSKWYLSWCFVVLLFALWGTAEDAFCEEFSIPERPNFSRDVQPIFASACTSCHGGVKQAADLSFVFADSILPPDGWIVEPGNPGESILMQRILSTDPDEKMPPPDEHANPLTEAEIETIRRWIEQGADWPSRWSIASLQTPITPEDVDANQWAKKPLDVLVHQSLGRRGLTPAKEAPPEQWLRRVTLDLTGLPPTVSELEAFQARVSEANGERDGVYGQVVDRLLGSEHFGERWAAMWLDLSRYADSQGFEKDPHRDIWPYRDWLIEAFNSDMPYDEFTVRQLAGDMLPEASYSDLIASAFHRNTQTNTEGGTDDEEFRIAAVIDRVNTTWTVWQGTTFGCTQCHAHPYEPFRNVEFYQCFDLFNSTADVDLASEYPTVPWIPDVAQQQEFLEGRKSIQETERNKDELGRQQVGRADWHDLVVQEAKSTSGGLGVERNQVRVASGTVAVGSTYTLTAAVDRIAAIRIEILPDSDDPHQWPEQGAVLSQLKVVVQAAAGASRPIPLDAVIPDFRAGPYSCEETLAGGAAGFGGYPKLFGPRWVVVTLAEPVDLAEGELLQIEMHQSASVAGGLSNHLRKFTLEASGEGIWETADARTQYVELASRLTKLRNEQKRFAGANVPVARDRDQAARRSTREFLRGNWLERGDVVEPGIPEVFAKTAASPPRVTNRLEFARWLVSDDNPLAARVWANRVWAELFGIGIVETLEDFGASGLPPTHPVLLEHLALGLRDENEWHLKVFLKRIVLSATYRQNSFANPELRKRDPRNRLLARGPRTRLSAEMIRDQALVASGKLTRKLGGPSVMPPQPDGIWQQVYSGAKWKTAEGPDRYRRAVYTYWKRTSPYPSMVAFDAPSRDICSPRRLVTNTPLQALVTLNSEVYHELAAGLAERVGQELPAGASVADGIRSMGLLVATRQMAAVDVEILSELYGQLGGKPNWQGVSTGADKPAAKGEKVEQEGRAASGVDSAMHQVALAILNSDWALTK